MPHTRRRRFSVQNDMEVREVSKPHHPISNMIPQKTNPEPKLTSQSNQTVKAKSNRSSSKSVSPPHALSESDSVVTVKKQSYSALHKNVSVNSNKINHYSINLAEELTDMLLSESSIVTKKQQEKDVLVLDPRRDRTPRNKLPRQHRIKVRSPKRYTSHEPVRFINQGTENIVQEKSSRGTDPIVTPVDIRVYTTNNYYNNEDDRQSNQSNEDICRICHGGESLNSEQGQLISACACRGTVGRVHVKCLERWLTESGKSRCELCSTRYATKRVHKYGIAKALVMWVLSQNAKQLLVDSLGIMLMSPLAVLAAWLSGRTLAGLMVDNHSHLAPWPLASTFVLACLTLVCYYCWIVSAATRHALGWWIWYRSQYEVRLELQATENS